MNALRHAKPHHLYDFLHGGASLERGFDMAPRARRPLNKRKPRKQDGKRHSNAADKIRAHDMTATAHVTNARAVAYAFPVTFLTAGGFHVPLMMEGGFSFGQYMRNIKMNLSFGAGSQLLFLSAPGDWFWT